MDKVKVSIFCATYNHEKYIEYALKGFVNQKTNFKYEVIVHDDSSTDNTVKIIEKYRKKYPDIIKPIYQKENIYSKGEDFLSYMLPQAKGEFIAFCEGDDYWIDNNKLQIQYDYMKENKDISFCTHAFNIIDENNNITSKTISHNEDIDFDIKTYLTDKKTYQTATVFCRKKYLENLPKYYYEASIGDLPMLLHLLSNGKGHYINKIMSNYRYMTPDSWTYRNKNNIELKQKNYEMVRNIYVNFNKHTKEKYNKEVCECLLKFDFNYAIQINNFNQIFDKKYSSLYNSLPLKQRIKLRLKSNNYIYDLYKKIKYRNKV